MEGKTQKGTQHHLHLFTEYLWLPESGEGGLPVQQEAQSGTHPAFEMSFAYYYLLHHVTCCNYYYLQALDGINCVYGSSTSKRCVAFTYCTVC